MRKDIELLSEISTTDGDVREEILILNSITNPYIDAVMSSLPKYYKRNANTPVQRWKFKTN